MKTSILEVPRGFWSLLVGMRVTLTQFFKPVVTVPYPRKTLPIPARYRGHIVLTSDPETGRPFCTACKLCERACPSDCILVDGVKLEGEKKKSVTEFKLDFTKCSLCGACVEVCPCDAIRFSKNYNLASTSKGDYIFDLVARLQAEKKQP
jgi:NADH-quinone oxidoreductase subunit I